MAHGVSRICNVAITDFILHLLYDVMFVGFYLGILDHATLDFARPHGLLLRRIRLPVVLDAVETCIMTSTEVLNCFKTSDALLDGHFVLRSGLHSRQFFQCAMLMQYPREAERVCRALADMLGQVACDSVISPALGGIIVGHEVGRALNKRHIFAEKEDGRLVLRRGFQISPQERFIVVEDVVTRGGRVQETIDIVRSRGGSVAAVAVLVDRSEQTPEFGCPFISLLRLQVTTYAPECLPPDLAAIPAVKPGSK